ncbi:MAG: hypothetical protein J5936_04140 [Acholeplasmatales bacterium]|jgi:F-type H+-transporting ATPase subunit epsilon|nr:hypothetical protein [Acholeplasmatales bacterium]MBQ6783526.1 hypothetical protein [Acholeplasmatales bacterium]
MQIIISTHQGNLYNDKVDYLVVHSVKDGEYACMENHVPVISVIDEGYVKLVRDKDEFYVVIVSGVFQFHDNVGTVLCQEAHIGRTVESAKKHLDMIRKERLEQNKKDTVDFTQKEKELREHIRNSGAGSL